MFNEYSGIKVLKLFLRKPYEEFHLREIARLTKVSPSTAKRFLDTFEKNRIVLRKRKGNLAIFNANIDSPVFRQIKITYNIFMIESSGLMEELTRDNPASIILYGSTAKGLDSEDSDIDLMVIGRKYDADLSKLEKKLRRKINLITYSPAEWSKKAKYDRPFYNNVITGILLHGEMPIE